MRKINQKTVEKHFAFLNSFEDGKKYNGQKVRKKNHVGCASLGVAIKLGLLEKNGKWHVKAKEAPFTTGDAEALCWGMNEYNRSLIAKRNKKAPARILTGTNKEVQAIAYLKQRGYKILKPINEFKEV